MCNFNLEKEYRFWSAAGRILSSIWDLGHAFMGATRCNLFQRPKTWPWQTPFSRARPETCDNFHMVLKEKRRRRHCEVMLGFWKRSKSLWGVGEESNEVWKAFLYTHTLPVVGCSKEDHQCNQAPVFVNLDNVVTKFLVHASIAMTFRCSRKRGSICICRSRVPIATDAYDFSFFLPAMA